MNDIKNPRTLSKSRFKSALECPTKLYYYGKKKEYANQMAENEFMMALAEGGFQVGELAKYSHPCCEDMGNCGHHIQSLTYHDSLAETAKYIHNENVILYEPAVAFENLFIRIDVLGKNGNEVELIEVKAKSYDSKKGFRNKNGIGEFIASSWRPYLYDVAFQTWVMEQAYPDWNVKPYLMMADKAATATVDGINQLFRVKKNENNRTVIEVTEEITPERLGDSVLVKVPVREYVEMIWNGQDINPLKKEYEEYKNFFERAREYAGFYERDERYPVTVGLKCKHCEYKNTPDSAAKGLKSGYEECWQEKFGDDFDFEEPHVFELWNFRHTRDALERGIYFLKDLIYEDLFKSEPKIPEKGMASVDRQWLQVNKRTGRDMEDEHINPELFDEMNEWDYPLHFIDFETSMVSIPFTSGRRPYEQTAFQFSCHSLHKDGRMEHREWINGEPGVFPNYEFTLALKKTLGNDDGTIFRYSNHENTVMRQIHRQIENDDEIDVFKDSGTSNAEIMDWIDTITNWEVIDLDGKKSRDRGDRDMIDLWKCVKSYYYHPMMKGSNSIKQVLPTVMNVSDFLKAKYSKPLEFGINLKSRVLWQADSNGKVLDPYKLLEPIHDDISGNELYLERGEIQDGGAAMVAYAKLQFTQMSDSEREAIIQALLRYCEMDTLAMVMIYDHWHNCYYTKHLKN
jgi:hypothetical protein